MSEPRIAMVTGASTGLGRDSALALARAGQWRRRPPAGRFRSFGQMEQAYAQSFLILQIE